MWLTCLTLALPVDLSPSPFPSAGLQVVSTDQGFSEAGSTSDNPFFGRTIIGGQQAAAGQWSVWDSSSDNAKTIAGSPFAQWLTGDADKTKMEYVFDQADSASIATFVLYYVQSASDYNTWISTIADYRTEHSSIATVYIIEPDAMAKEISEEVASGTYSDKLNTAIVGLGCGSSSTICYLDVGNYGWMFSPVDRTSALVSAVTSMSNYQNLRGFSSGVSHYFPVRYELQYAQSLSDSFSDKVGVNFHAIIDTSRNGQDTALSHMSVWCNMDGTGSGPVPTATSSAISSDYADFEGFVDAFLYVKTPGVGDGSDSSCTSSSSGDCCVDGTMWAASGGSKGCSDASNFCEDMASMLATNANFSPSYMIPADDNCGCWGSSDGNSFWYAKSDYCDTSEEICLSENCKGSWGAAEWMGACS